MSISHASSLPAPVDIRTARRLSILALLAASIFVMALIATLLFSDNRRQEALGGADGILGGDFSLQGINGEVGLADYRGKVVVLYFGFLSCPEVCPTSMGILTQTLNKLTEEQRQNVQPILISIDPARDKVKQLADFTTFYHPQIIGLTGSETQLQAVAADYGAYYQAKPADTPELDYVFDHSSRYYVINPAGKLVDAMRHSTTANELVARIRTLL